ncbi:hypothetical protein GCM10027408_34660 [Microbacterium tumbae]
MSGLWRFRHLVSRNNPDTPAVDVRVVACLVRENPQHPGHAGRYGCVRCGGMLCVRVRVLCARMRMLGPSSDHAGVPDAGTSFRGSQGTIIEVVR